MELLELVEEIFDRIPDSGRIDYPKLKKEYTKRDEMAALSVVEFAMSFIFQVKYSNKALIIKKYSSFCQERGYSFQVEDDILIELLATFPDSSQLPDQYKNIPPIETGVVNELMDCINADEFMAELSSMTSPIKKVAPESAYQLYKRNTENPVDYDEFCIVGSLSLRRFIAQFVYASVRDFLRQYKIVNKEKVNDQEKLYAFYVNWNDKANKKRELKYPTATYAAFHRYFTNLTFRRLADLRIGGWLYYTKDIMISDTLEQFCWQSKRTEFKDKKELYKAYEEFHNKEHKNRYLIPFNEFNFHYRYEEDDGLKYVKVHANLDDPEWSYKFYKIYCETNWLSPVTKEVFLDLIKERIAEKEIRS